MASTPSPTYEEHVWERVEAQTGSFSEPCRAAWRSRIATFEGHGLEAAHTAADLIELIGWSVRAFQQGLATFNLMVRTAKEFEKILQDDPERTEIMDYMTDGRVQLMKLYLDLSHLAPRAGLDDVVPPEVVAVQLEEAEADRERWRTMKAKAPHRQT